MSSLNTYRIADAHCDTLFSIGVGGCDPMETTVTKKRMEAGGVSLQTFALFAGGDGPAGDPYGKAQAMLCARERLGVPLYEGPLPDQMPDTPHGVLSLEGGEILQGSIARLDEFDERHRVRLIALTWNNENEIGYPSKIDGPGLKPFGLRLLREMDRRGIYADVSHLSEKGFWDIVDRMDLPPVASHSNYRPLCDVHRNLTREQARAIIEKKGYIGINFYSAFIVSQGRGTLEELFRHIDALMELGAEHVLGFGSDFDGIDRWPEGIDDPSFFPALCDKLLSRGYTDAQVEAIAGGNYFRLLKEGESRRKAQGF